jgi:hypothetical protein
MNTSLTRTRNRPWGLLEPDAWKAGSSGSEGAGAQQCAPATRGWRIQRHQQRGSRRRYVYTYPSRKALAAVKAKVRAVAGQTTNQSLGLWTCPGSRNSDYLLAWLVAPALRSVDS